MQLSLTTATRTGKTLSLTIIMPRMTSPIYPPSAIALSATRWIWYPLLKGPGDCRQNNGNTDFGTAITDYETARLVESNKPGGNVTGTTDMNPIKEQIDLLVKLVPGVETVGVLYNSSEDNSVVQAEIAKKIIEERGLKYTEVTVSSSNEVQQATQAIVKECDAIYIPTDNTFAASMPVVHGVTVQSKTPLSAANQEW